MPDPRFFRKSRASYTVAEIAALVGAVRVQADNGDMAITDVAALQDAGNTDISFLQNPKYLKVFRVSRAGACFVEPNRVADAPDGMALIVVKDAYKAYGRFAALLYPEPTAAERRLDVPVHPSAQIHPLAVVSPSASIGANVEIGARSYIGANVTIGAGVRIGEDSHVHAGASLQYCLIGDRVVIHPNAAIGQRGFGVAPDRDKPVKIPQLGRVLIGNDVEIGACTAIDRGAGPDTVIGDGTMIDNLVQIAHNVRIGKNCILVGQVGISGSAELGDFVVLGGQAGVAGHVKIGHNVQIASKSGVTKDIPSASVMAGFPAVPIDQWRRQMVEMRRVGRGRASPVTGEDE